MKKTHPRVRGDGKSHRFKYGRPKVVKGISLKHYPKVKEGNGKSQRFKSSSKQDYIVGIMKKPYPKVRGNGKSPNFCI